ncbi:PAS domain-containing sensor histidine kinase [Chryseolinea sp. H1M3-3]|uniref:sensor histidine kinase n=1 Tax=Chryseolinea sp. H1M3-3 TaxID=3034144 RepID=UPI0023ED4337|nr:PAS domain-containing sensor histidine kinase [Chryseolinea sp. H1M3-3]
MICYTGFGRLIEKLKSNLNDRWSWVEITEPENMLSSVSQAFLFLIGPEHINPIRLVQRIVAIDSHISIVILTLPAQLSKIKQMLLFSPFVGKNVLCIAYRENINFDDVFNDAILRTQQKRSFYKINLHDRSKIQPIKDHTVTISHLGNFLEQLPMGVILINDRDEIVATNKFAKKYFEILKSSENVTARNIFSPGQLTAIKMTCGMEDNGSPHVMEVLEILMEYSCSFVKDEKGEHFILFLFSDITERAEKEKRVQVILEALPQVAWTCNAKGEVDYMTKNWYEYTGRAFQDAQAKQWIDVLHPDDLPGTIKRWNECFKAGKILQHAARFKKFTGEYFWHLIRGVPVFNKSGEVVMWVGTNTDIHDQIRLTDELEHTVRERTKLLQETNAELEQFAYVASHDLQEPLRKIKTFADILNESCRSILDDDSKKYLEKIINTSSRMTLFLKDLLELSKLNNLGDREQVDINIIIQQVLEDLELAIHQKQATVLKTNLLPVIHAIRFHIKQLFYNIISNAVKFSNSEVVPLITIESRTMTPDEVVKFSALSIKRKYCEIKISDNGIGFDQRYASQIFTVFQRLHPRQKFEGTGIGLALCKKIVNILHGEIYATSVVNEGSTFYIILPLD